VNLRLERFGFGLDSTLGVLSIDGMAVAFTIEDERRKVKLPKETCIPAGVYPLRVRKYGRFHESYAKRFSGLHEGMIEVDEVPGFSNILIHCGNNDDETEGCVLLVTTPVVLPDGEFQGSESSRAYGKVYPRIIKAMAAGLVSLVVTEREAA